MDDTKWWNHKHTNTRYFTERLNELQVLAVMAAGAGCKVSAGPVTYTPDADAVAGEVEAFVQELATRVDVLHGVHDRLAALSLDTLTPTDALIVLYELKRVSAAAVAESEAIKVDCDF